MNGYDCFFSYNSADRAIVEQIVGHVEAVGLRVWFDSTALPAGARVLPGLEGAIQSVACVVVFWGGSGSGPWHDLEMDIAVVRERRGELRVIPVLLPGAPTPHNLPDRLSGYSFVDLRAGINDSDIQGLIRGIKTAVGLYEGDVFARNSALPPAQPVNPDLAQVPPSAANSRLSEHTPCINEIDALIEDTKAKFDQVNIIGQEGETQPSRNSVKAVVRNAEIGTLNIIGNRTSRPQ